MVGMRTSVKTLLSRLWREREGRRAWLGVGVVGVQKLFLLAYRVPGVGYDLKRILLLKSNTQTGSLTACLEDLSSVD